ncbi:hypothetical protein HNY73_015778 [Argiope bruennichi]|uniref:Uncharacterized protein n=1 Tax=Argiope bruennichi TaxID=94029 RepID=A0A8T0EHX1_ARGBR|nr:hypothetical protein HNY73_015778 [Argiope bruennichi]
MTTRIFNEFRLNAKLRKCCDQATIHLFSWRTTGCQNEEFGLIAFAVRILVRNNMKMVVSCRSHLRRSSLLNRPKTVRLDLYPILKLYDGFLRTSENSGMVLIRRWDNVCVEIPFPPWQDVWPLASNLIFRLTMVRVSNQWSS